MMLGSGARLVSVAAVAQEAGVQERAARRWLADLEVPILKVGERELVLLAAVEIAVTLRGLPPAAKTTILGDPNHLLRFLELYGGMYAGARRADLRQYVRHLARAGRLHTQQARGRPPPAPVARVLTKNRQKLSLDS